MCFQQPRNAAGLHRFVLGYLESLCTITQRTEVSKSSYSPPSRWCLWPLTNDYKVVNMEVSFLPKIGTTQSHNLHSRTVFQEMAEAYLCRSIVCNHTLVCFFHLFCPTFLMPLPVSPGNISIVNYLHIWAIPKVSFWGMRSKRMLEMHSTLLAWFFFLKIIKKKQKEHLTSS